MPFTLTGNVLAITGTGAALPIRVKLAGSAPTVTAGGSVVARQTKHYRSNDDGDFTLALAPGYYEVTFGDGPTLQILITEDSGSGTFKDAINDSVITPTPVTPTPDPDYLPASQAGHSVFIVNGKQFFRNPATGWYRELKLLVGPGDVVTTYLDPTEVENPA